VLVKAINATNLTIVGAGAEWVMRKGDYSDPTKYNHSESRHALAMYGCTDIIIKGLLLGFFEMI
jgi:hypothetical protein